MRNGKQGRGRVSAVAALLLALLAPPSLAGWVSEDIVGTKVYTIGSFRFSPAGTPALAYGKDGLYYAVREGGTWRTEVVDVDPTGCLSEYGLVSLAFDAAGNPAIAHVATWLPSLIVQVARWDGTRWVRWLVSAGPWSPALVQVSLAADPDGTVALAYHDPTTLELMFVREGGVPESTGVLGARGLSLGFDGTGRPSISFMESGLKLARREAAGWTVETVDPATDLTGSTLAFDAAGRPSIGYAQFPGTGVRLAAWDGSVWQLSVEYPVAARGISLAFAPGGERFLAYTRSPSGLELNGEVVDPLGQSAPSIALDPVSGEPWIAYLDGPGRLWVALRQGTSWSFERIEDLSMPGIEGSLAFDRDGRPSVAYHETRGRDLRYAVRDGGGFAIETVDADGDVGRSPSLAIAPDGAAEIAYVDVTSRRVKRARRDGAGWAIDEVGGTESPSLAFGPDGRPLVSLFDGPSREVKLARWNGTAWQLETVDGPFGGSAPVLTSLALDREGRPWVAYHDPVDWDLELARFDDTRWVTEKVDDTSRDVYPALAFDAVGLPAISYRSGNQVKFARSDGAAWRLEVVDTSVEAGAASLAFDPAGTPVVAYRERSLFVRRRGPTGWSLEVADAIASVGSAPSLAIDPSGNVHVSHHDACGQDLLLTYEQRAGTLLRLPVAALAPGWKGAALPLTSANDDEMAPFPLAVAAPGGSWDPLPAAAPLVLYRLLGPGDTPFGNGLRATKVPGGVGLRF